MYVARVRPVRRTVQVVMDLVVLGWVVGWFLAARAVRGVVAALAEPFHDLGDTAERIADSVDGASAQLGEVPLVGEQLSAPFQPVSEALRDVTAQTSAQAQVVLDTADLLFWVVWAIPTLTVALLYLPARIRRAREAAAARGFVDGMADLDLFALRAMARAPMAELARIDPDPVAAWRARDQHTIRQLADLELRRVGIGVVEYSAEPIRE